MKKQDIIALLNLLLTPILLILLGLILLFNPDSASAIIAKFLGWIVLAVGIGFAVSALVERTGTAGKVIGAIACIALGGWLLKNPLVLAAGIGRLAGILLIIRGVRDLLDARKYKTGILSSIIVTALGAVLVALPMTTSRLVFSLCGLVVLVIGIVMLLDRVKNGKRRLKEPDDPDIIDAL